MTHANDPLIPEALEAARNAVRDTLMRESPSVYPKAVTEAVAEAAVRGYIRGVKEKGAREIRNVTRGGLLAILCLIPVPAGAGVGLLLSAMYGEWLILPSILVGSIVSGILALRLLSVPRDRHP